MKQPIKLMILTWIFVTIIFYLCISFGQGTFYPNEMDKDARTFTAIFWLMAIFCSGAIVINSDIDKNE